MESNVAFTDAVARARQIAAKLGAGAGPAVAPPTSSSNGSNGSAGGGGGFNPNPLTGGLPTDKGNPNNMPLGLKRSFPGGDDEYVPKKPTTEPDAITAQLRAIADQQRVSAKDAAKAAAEQVAAKLNQSLGGGGPPPPGLGPHAGLGLSQSEEWSIPNKSVGIVIGSKGESISQIQAQSGCRIQIAPDPAPGQMMQERQVSLSGTAESIARAKELINRCISEAGHNMAGAGGGSGMGFSGGDYGGQTIEVMIPANKVGLIIGKGGETIKQLQNRTGCKMMMVQDGPYQNAAEKPLKITGDPASIDSARKVVKELMDSKDIVSSKSDSYNGYGSSTADSIPVPREAVGIIIGKGGDMIKTIQSKFNVKIQFQNDTGGPQRICDISGGSNDVYATKQHIQELIAENANRRGGSGGRSGGGFGGRGGGGGGGGGYGQDQTTMRVPADRCGIVIGKGGENIRQICEMSGAHVELNRNAPPGPDKEFQIRGTPDQIQHAMHLINEKVSVPPRGGGGGGQGGHGGWGGPSQGGHYGGGPGGWGGPPGGPHGGPGGPGGYGSGPPQQQGGWGNYSYNQWGQQGGQTGGHSGSSGGEGDQNSQSQDQAAWQAYYAQYYGQYPQGGAAAGAQAGAAAGAPQPPAPGAPTSQASAAQISQAQPAQPSAGSAASGGQAAAGAGGNPQPKINPVTGEADYTEAWVAYYRQMGWHDQAEAILKQSQSGQQQGQSSS